MSARASARNLRIAAAALAFATALGAAPRKSQPAEDQPEPKEGVRVERLDGVTAYYAEGAGRILSVATPRTPDSKSSVLMLVAPKPPKVKKDETAEPKKKEPSDNCGDPTTKLDKLNDKPRRLLRFDPTGEGELRVLRQDLTPDARELFAADVNADGRDDLVVVERSGISVLVADENGAWSHALERVATLPKADNGTRQVGTFVDETGAVSVWTTDLGAIRTFTRGPEGTWKEAPSVPVPVRAKKEGSFLSLRNAEVVPLSAPAGPAPLATKPDAAGGDRLISYLLRPGAAAGDARSECWSHLPAPERVLESQYLQIDGSPVLFVTTRPAEKLSLFGEKLVRLFPLGADRTRMGKTPLFAVESGANLWQGIHPSLRDVNGDGREDLVLAYWKGLSDNSLVLDAYLRRPDGSFEPKAKTTTFDLETADRAILDFGADVDRLDRPDLMLSTQQDLVFHRGTAPSADVRKLVDARAAWKAPLPGASYKTTSVEISIGDEGMDYSFDQADWNFAVVDLDRDGSTEILCTPPKGSVSEAVAVYRPGGR